MFSRLLIRVVWSKFINASLIVLMMQTAGNSNINIMDPNATIPQQANLFQPSKLSVFQNKNMADMRIYVLLNVLYEFKD